MAELTIRRATVRDSETILTLINELAAQQVMLPRSPVSIIENIRDFAVAELDGAFAGCGALHVVWTDLAEVRSLAVPPGLQKRGVGRRLVYQLIEDALQLGIAKLFAFTYVPGFFARCGFAEVEHATLPHKVFGDCLNCPKFNCCDEIAMVRVLREEPEPHPRGPLSLAVPRPRTRP